jgi:hypothetical protein
MMKIKPRDMVTTTERKIRYQVQRVHRDGTVSLFATWKLQPNGRDVAVAEGGYIGEDRLYVRLPASDLIAAEYPGKVML